MYKRQTLTYRYTIREKQDSMERNAEFIAEFTGAMTAKGGSLLDSSCQAYVSSIASISDAYVLLCRMDGRVQLYSSGSIREGVAAPSVPGVVCREVIQNGRYSGLTNLGGLFAERRYVAGRAVMQSDFLGQQYETHLVFVAADKMCIRDSPVT